MRHLVKTKKIYIQKTSSKDLTKDVKRGAVFLVAVTSCLDD